MTERELAIEFGNNLQTVLDDYNLTQRELCKMSGVDKSVISRYIHGEQIPKLKHVINIAYALECDIRDLLCTDEFIE